MIKCCQGYSKLKGAKTNDALTDSMGKIIPTLVEHFLRTVSHGVAVARMLRHRNIRTLRLVTIRSPTAATAI